MKNFMSSKQTYQYWVDHPNMTPLLKNELLKMYNHSQEIEDSFAGPLKFGTAGMRGLMGAGINRLNIYTVRWATLGLLKVLLDKKDHIKIVIGYDGRHHSAEFAKEAAKVIIENRQQALLFKEVCPTPELAYSVRNLQCDAGIMITASHNPAEYNGYKVYGADGGQISPVIASEIMSYLNQIDPLKIKASRISVDKIT